LEASPLYPGQDQEPSIINEREGLLLSVAVSFS